MAPATKKQRVSDDGNATAYPAPELSHEQNDDEETETEDEESPMSIIAQFQSEDVRRMRCASLLGRMQDMLI
jgi:hypothetical protein